MVVMDDSILNRIGKIRIIFPLHIGSWQHNLKKTQKVLEKVLILDTTAQVYADSHFCISYVGLSTQFDLLSKGEKIPLYSLKKMKTLKHKDYVFERIEEGP